MDLKLLLLFVAFLFKSGSSGKACSKQNIKIFKFKSQTLDWFKVKAIPNASALKKAMFGYPWDEPGENAFHGKLNTDQMFVFQAADGGLWRASIKLYVKFGEQVEFQATYANGSKSTITVRPRPSQSWDINTYSSTGRLRYRRYIQKLEVTVRRLRGENFTRLQRKIRVADMLVKACPKQ